ncbi:hypothetical protein [Archangium lipolyticum]|uniref:hypothetical protein n=1 Tax=Archangium lipolyticum TaxID=2970465 RepID=UPI00214A0C3D|nr:hypothetical protein [Archangium lipolyticum]
MFHRVWLAGVLMVTPVLQTSLAAEVTTWRELESKHGGGPGLRACVAQAKEDRPEVWTCMGGELTTAQVGADGKAQVSSRMIAEDIQDTTRAQEGGADDSSTSAPEGMAPLAADDYDSWCENGSVCARKIGNHTAEVKGNGAYGDARGVIGALDFVVRQSFNGPYPRWRGLLIWDYGPTITPNSFYNACRINVVGPDRHCGINTMYFGTISSARQRTWWPSSTRYDQHTTRLRGSTNYHDDNYGSFHASGYPQTFFLPTIHTGRWNNCGSSTGCRYYQVPWVP